MFGAVKDFHGSVDFKVFWLDMGRISIDPWSLVRIWRILVKSGKDFHGSVDFEGFIFFYKFWLDLGRISFNP